MSVEGVPERSVISVNSRPTKQTMVSDLLSGSKSSQPFSSERKTFRLSSTFWPLKIDLSQRIGKTASDASLAGADGDGLVKLPIVGYDDQPRSITFRVQECAESAATAQPDTDAVVNEYFQLHGISDFIRENFDLLLAQCPDDPYQFLARRFRARAAHERGDASESTPMLLQDFREFRGGHGPDAVRRRARCLLRHSLGDGRFAKVMGNVDMGSDMFQEVIAQAPLNTGLTSIKECDETSLTSGGPTRDADEIAGLDMPACTFAKSLRAREQPVRFRAKEQLLAAAAKGSLMPALLKAQDVKPRDRAKVLLSELAGNDNLEKALRRLPSFCEPPVIGRSAAQVAPAQEEPQKQAKASRNIAETAGVDKTAAERAALEKVAAQRAAAAKRAEASRADAERLAAQSVAEREPETTAAEKAETPSDGTGAADRVFMQRAALEQAAVEAQAAQMRFVAAQLAAELAAIEKATYENLVDAANMQDAVDPCSAMYPGDGERGHISLNDAMLSRPSNNEMAQQYAHAFSQQSQFVNQQQLIDPRGKLQNDHSPHLSSFVPDSRPDTREPSQFIPADPTADTPRLSRLGVPGPLPFASSYGKNNVRGDPGFIDDEMTQFVPTHLLGDAMTSEGETPRLSQFVPAQLQDPLSGNISGRAVQVLDGTPRMSHCIPDLQENGGLDGTPRMSHCIPDLQANAPIIVPAFGGTPRMSHCIPDFQDHASRGVRDWNESRSPSLSGFTPCLQSQEIHSYDANTDTPRLSSFTPFERARDTFVGHAAKFSEESLDLAHFMPELHLMEKDESLAPDLSGRSFPMDSVDLARFMPVELSCT